jgi:hypothetical protein
MNWSLSKNKIRWGMYFKHGIKEIPERAFRKEGFFSGLYGMLCIFHQEGNTTFFSRPPIT